MRPVRALSEILADAERRLLAGDTAAPKVWPTGFSPLDVYLAGGLRSGELAVVGGQQSVGKTTFVLQVARHVAQSGGTCLYFSYEHDATTILERFLAMEATAVSGEHAPALRRVRQALEGEEGSGGLADRLPSGVGAKAVAALDAYADRVLVHRSSSTVTSVEAIDEMLGQTILETGSLPLVVVDYLQKVSTPVPATDEESRMATVAGGLKDLALRHGVPVVAVASADREGLASGRRIRVHHLHGASSVAYEADVILLMNDKFDAVARHHLVYDVAKADSYRRHVIISLEKNRSGLDRIDLEFRKLFEHGCLDPLGSAVDEALVDDRVYLE